MFCFIVHSGGKGNILMIRWTCKLIKSLQKVLGRSIVGSWWRRFNNLISLVLILSYLKLVFSVLNSGGPWWLLCQQQQTPVKSQAHQVKSDFRSLYERCCEAIKGFILVYRLTKICAGTPGHSPIKLKLVVSCSGSIDWEKSRSFFTVAVQLSLKQICKNLEILRQMI